MKTIGLLGGMSWESTIPYYRIINEEVHRRLGGLHSARIVLHSVDFQEIERCQAEENWEKSGAILAEAAAGLAAAGADFLVICTNTMHKVVPQIQERAALPVLHIAQATAAVLRARGVRRAALLGTRYTMEQDFYRAKLSEEGIASIVPEGDDARLVNDVIYQELCQGVCSEESRRAYLRIMDDLAGRGAQGVILGCTEIGLLIRQEDTSLPVFDTARIHAQAAARYALEGN